MMPNFQRFSATMKPIVPTPSKPKQFMIFSSSRPVKVGTTEPNQSASLRDKTPMKNMELRVMQPPQQQPPQFSNTIPIQSQNQETRNFHSNLILRHQNVVGPNFQTNTVFAPSSKIPQDVSFAQVNPVHQNFLPNSFNPINRAIQANTQPNIIPVQPFQLNNIAQQGMDQNTNSIQSNSAFGANIRPLHVFQPAPTRSNFHPPQIHRQPQQVVGPRQNVGLAHNSLSSQNIGPPQNSLSTQNGRPTHDILSNLTPEQLDALRQQLHANSQQSFGTNFDQNLNNKRQQMEDFRSSQNSLSQAQFVKPVFTEITTEVPTTTTTTTVPTTKRPINFHLKSRERLRHRSRKRGRNPIARITSRPTSNHSKQPSFIRPSPNTNVNRRTEPSEKPNLFDPFVRVSRLEPINKEFKLDTSLETAQNFAPHQNTGKSFSQSKMNAFANLLAIANDSPTEALETTTAVVPSTTPANIALISLGEGGLIPTETQGESVEQPKNSKVNRFEFFTPRSMDKKITPSAFGISTTMGSPIVPAFEDAYPNFVMISSTSPPQTFSTSPPRLTFEDSSLTESTKTTQTTVATDFNFAPTPMTKSKDDLHVFSFQPTPMTKRFRFRPTTKPRKFQFPEEAFADNSISNEIENFSPKFVVDPDMKEKFAIVKVKNHNLVQSEKAKLKSAAQLKEDRSKPIDEASINQSTTTLPPRERVKNLISKNPVRKRGRLIKKLKSQRNPFRSKSNGTSKSKTRRRYQFIRRVTLMPKLINQQKGRGGASKLSQKEENNVIAEAANAIDAGKSLLDINSEAKKNEIEADAKVAALANNILELKAKLEQLKMELQV